MIYSLLYIRKKFYIIRQTTFIVLKKPTNIKSNGIKLRKISHHIIVVWDFFIEKY